MSNTPIQQETRRYDEGSGKTVLMRVKTDAVDYKYFPEPNIAPIQLSEQFIEEAINTCPELYDSKKMRYLTYGLPEKDVEIILSSLDSALYFEQAIEGVNYVKTIANFLIVEINSYLNKRGIGIKELPLSPESLRSIAAYQEEGYSHKQCADILFYCLEHDGATPETAKVELKIEKQISDDSAIRELVNQVLEANPQSIEDYKNGKGRAVGFLIGQAMKLSKGKANPQAVSKIMNEELARR